jgi:predicted metalloprotease
MMELVQQLVAGAGVSASQAEGGAGLLFGLVKDRLSGGDFSCVADAVPGIEGLIDTAPDSAGGLGQAAMGPFYCPGDQKVYIDLAFYSDLKTRFQAPGDFAQAYVIAHEVGHHVQTLLGIPQKVQRAKQGLGEVEQNRLTVRQELQADCLAGIWAHHADRSRQLLESGDVEEGLVAASAIGDDRLQKQSQGYVTPTPLPMAVRCSG